MSAILSVRELTEAIRHNLEGRFPYVWVRGEVTNVSRPTSGHLYFGLKDEDALLRCVWFRNSQRDQEAFDPLTGEVFAGGPRPSLAKELRNGRRIICAGRLGVYAPRGEYQLIVELGQDSGEGALFLALEELKRKLAAKGYFSLERKRPLPPHPVRVSVITAPTGAAIHDFLRVSSRRGTGFEVRLRPVPVQGDDAPPRIVEAIRRENEAGWAEVLVIIRGGGSLQDLQAFNDERVAEAVFGSAIPVLAGIGHEVDTSLSDMTADVRAATPSHAAQLLWPERQWYIQRADELEMNLHAAFARRTRDFAEALDRMEHSLAWFSPQRGFVRQRERLANLAERLDSAWERRLNTLSNRLCNLENAVRRNGTFPRHPLLAERAAELSRRLAPAQERFLLLQQEAVRKAEARLAAAWPRMFTLAEHRLDRLELRLAARNPEAPLERGYALAVGKDGRFIRSVRELAPGSTLTLKIRDGEADARVFALRPTGE